MINALIYPAILLVMVTLSLMFLLGYVVPQFAAMYDSLDAPLPWFSRLVLGLGMFVRGWWWALLAVPVLAVVWLDRKRRDPVFRAKLDAWLLERRFAGPLVAARDRAPGAHARHPAEERRAVADRAGHRPQRAREPHAGRRGRSRCGRGQERRRPVRRAGAQQALPAAGAADDPGGEESGALDGMLLKTADTFEQETGLALDRMLAALVPVVTMVLAAVVGMVILAVLSPIYDLTNVIG